MRIGISFALKNTQAILQLIAQEEAARLEGQVAEGH